MMIIIIIITKLINNKNNAPVMISFPPHCIRINIIIIIK